MSPRIVIIDDAPEIVQLYTDILTDAGYTVVATFIKPLLTPQEIEQHRPDLIILDWLFQGQGTGMQTLEMLTASPSTAGIPIIVCSAARRELEEAEHIITQRGVRILHKTFSLDDLVALIQDILP
jgi:DNA-binding response OmpR family regulator